MRNSIILISLLLLSVMGYSQQSLDEHYDVITPVQTQLDGYNTGDIELFLSAYSDSVKVYNYPDEFSYQGKDKMRVSYGGMFKNLPDLHCRLVGRMVLGNKVIDQEYVIFQKDGKPLHAIAIYTVKDGLIQEVRFMR
ncbi:MAG: nuclear transport factor 2 family protein [Bacteroidota bacterium]